MIHSHILPGFAPGEVVIDALHPKESIIDPSRARVILNGEDPLDSGYYVEFIDLVYGVTRKYRRQTDQRRSVTLFNFRWTRDQRENFELVADAVDPRLIKLYAFVDDPRAGYLDEDDEFGLPNVEPLSRPTSFTVLIYDGSRSDAERSECLGQLLMHKAFIKNESSNEDYVNRMDELVSLSKLRRRR